MAMTNYEKKAAKEAARYAKRKQEYNAMMKKVYELRAAGHHKAATKLEAKAIKKNSKISESAGDHIFNIITSIVLIAVIIIVGYPVLFVVSASFSSSEALRAGLVSFLPVDFTLDGYKFILDYRMVWVGYRNSIFYTVTGVIMTMAATILTAYPLSKRNYQGRNGIMFYFYLTTLFGAGLIPTFLVKMNLGLFNNVWAVMLQGTVAVSHVIILRTAFSSSIPGELFDAAKIDGANDFQCLFQIALPLAKATLSVLVLYIIVGAWNEYFTSMIYLQDSELWPLQLVLKPIMTAANTAQMDTSGMNASSQQTAEDGLEQVRYGLIMVSTVPPLVAYFVVQKAFKSGVMVGSVKG